MKRTILEVKDLYLVLRGCVVLESISLSLDEGEVVCVAGRNGAGKTSFLKSLVGLERRYTGRVHFSQRDPEGGRFKEVGVLIGGNSLYTHLSGWQNLDIIRRYYKLPRHVVDETINLVGLADAADKAVRYYSSGMKQRLAVGMTFVHRPRLVILDEPLNALDPEAVLELRELIRRLNQSFGTTFIITSHSLSEIGQIFTRLLIFREGRLVLNEKREELDTYWWAKTDSEHFPQVFNLCRDLMLYCRRKDDYTEIVGRKDRIAELKSIDQTWSWIEEAPLSLEDVYLYVNSEGVAVPSSG